MDWAGTLIAPEQNQKLEVLLSEVQRVPEVDRHIPWPTDLPEKDQPVFVAAISIQADYFMTGDITQLGEYFGKSVREGQNLPAVG